MRAQPQALTRSQSLLGEYVSLKATRHDRGPLATLLAPAWEAQGRILQRPPFPHRSLPQWLLWGGLCQEVPVSEWSCL